MNKVINSGNIIIALLLFFFSMPMNGNAQDSLFNQYGLYVIGHVTDYRAGIRRDQNKEMIDLEKLIPMLALDLRYAGKHNFTRSKLYPSLKTTFLRKPAAMALAAVQRVLNKKGLGLKIFDAYRPYRFTEKMWELVKDERYVANPKNGSGHNRGISVDLTIIVLATKKPFDMGTDFDNFTDTAHHSFKGLQKEVLQNRFLLKDLMEKHGFKALETEWWHYSFANGAGFELLDIEFEEFRKRKF